MSEIIKNINSLAGRAKKEEITKNAKFILGVYDKLRQPQARFVPKTIDVETFFTYIQERILNPGEILPQNFRDAILANSEASGTNYFITINKLIEVLNDFTNTNLIPTFTLVSELETYEGNSPLALIIDNGVRNLYIYDNQTEEWILFESGGVSELEENVFVNTINNIQIGETLQEGLTFTEYIKKKYQAIFNPTFNTDVSATLTSSITGTIEVGQTINPILTVAFNRGTINGVVNPDGTWNAAAVQNPRAGIASLFVINGDLSNENSAQVSRVIVLGNNTFTSSVNYLAGVQPLNSLGQPFGSPLPSGSVNSNNVVLTGSYRIFHGNAANPVTNSVEVRALTGVFTLTSINITTTRYVIAILATRNLTSVITSNNEQIVGNFTLQTFNVNDGGGNPVSYKVYTLETVLPLNLTATVTIV